MLTPTETDRFIIGYYDKAEDWVWHVCSICGHEWEEHMFYEMGTWFYVEGPDCPKCKGRGEPTDG